MNKKRVLLVDDEPDFLQMMGARLESSGCQVTKAKSGEEALEKIKQNRPDAVLLDIMMPGKDGLEILKLIRKKDKTLPVFILTALTDMKRFQMAKEYEASGFILKSGDSGESAAGVGEILNVAEHYESGSLRKKTENSHG